MGDPHARMPPAGDRHEGTPQRPLVRGRMPVHFRSCEVVMVLSQEPYNWGTSDLALCHGPLKAVERMFRSRPSCGTFDRGFERWMGRLGSFPTLAATVGHTTPAAIIACGP